MNEEEILDVLNEVGAIVADSHIVYTSGMHGTVDINMRALYSHVSTISNIGREIAQLFTYDPVRVVIAPAFGGIILSQWVAHYLSMIRGNKVLSIYAEKEEKLIQKARTTMEYFLGLPLLKGDELIIKKQNFIIKHSYGEPIFGKNVLVLDDVITSGESTKKVIELTRELGGNVIGLAAIWNRGEVRPQDVGNVPKIESLVNVKLDMWDEANCPMCKDGIPINTDLGHGAEFLASNRVQ